ncbi:hypothetical protein [Flaviaesturariibacter terrae]
MNQYHINSIDDVRGLLQYIYWRCGQPFDPAQDARTLLTSDGAPAFDEEEGAVLDSALLECFFYCIFNRIDLYRLLADLLPGAPQFRNVA